MSSAFSRIPDIHDIPQRGAVMADIGHNSKIMPGNWIAISRDMRNHPIVGVAQPVNPADPKRGSYSRYEAWQDLLMEAGWKSSKVSNKGKIVILDRGQIMASRSRLAARWNWSEKTVRGFISRLEDEFMVCTDTGQKKGQRVGHYSNVITICNYDIYQTASELLELEKGQSNGQSRASQGPVKGQSLTSKQENKEKEPTSLRSVVAPSALEGGDQEDAGKVVWGKGVEWLASASGEQKSKLKPLIGKWLKAMTADELLRAMRSAARAKTGDPIAYIGSLVSSAQQTLQTVRREKGRIVVGGEFKAELEEILVGRNLQRTLDQIAAKIPVGVSGIELEAKVRGMAIELVERIADQDRRYAAAASNKLNGSAPVLACRTDEPQFRGVAKSAVLKYIGRYIEGKMKWTGNILNTFGPAPGAVGCRIPSEWIEEVNNSRQQQI